MTRKYPYYPAFDGGKESDLIRRFVDLCGKRWKTKSIGTYNVRLMKNDHTAGKKIGDPGMDKYLSVHSTGYGADVQYPDEKTAEVMWNYFVAHSLELGICEIHWYAKGEYGWGYRCSRGEGKAGVKVFTKDDNAGSYQGSPNWLHVEIDKDFAGGADRWEEIFRAVKPA